MLKKMLVLLLLILLPTITNAEEASQLVITVGPTEIYFVDDQTGEQSSVPIEGGQLLEVVAIETDKVIVQWQEQVGFVWKEFIREPSEWERYAEAEVLEATIDAPIFVNENGQYRKRARLLKGERLKKVGVEGDYFIIEFGYSKAFIEKQHTKPVPDQTVVTRGVVNGQPTKWKRFVTMQTTNLYYSSNHQLAPFARIEEGMKWPIVGEHLQYYIVDLGGRKAYVKKAEVSTYTGNYVNPKTTYTYDQMVQDLKEFRLWYPEYTKLEVIGQSVDGRKLYAFKLGTGKEEVFINGSHHAREYMTTNILMEMMDQYAYAFQQNGQIDGYSVRKVLEQTSIWFVPMVNPDGVTLVQKGHKSAKNPALVLKLNGNKKDFSAWKANIRGVDLNRQYPADWENICCSPKGPGPQNYKGKKPLSEPEVKAMNDFTLNHSFKSAVAYHSSGEILYWHFHQGKADTKRDKALANKIYKKTGYKLVKPQKNPSGGGYTDWFIQSQKKPGFTPEIAPYVGRKPVPLKYFDSIWKENRSIGLLMAAEPIQ